MVIRCFSTLGCPDASLDQAFALARQHGLGGVELRALDGMVELPRYFAREFGTPEKLGAHCRTAGVPIVALATSLKLIGASERDRNDFLEFLPWAEAAGVRWLRVFDGGTLNDASALAEASDAVRWWTALRSVRQWKADIMVETHDTLLTAADIQRFVAAVPGIAIRWDSHHTWKKGGEDPVKTWDAIRRSVVHIDVKDSISVPSARHPYTYVLPGDGSFPIAPLWKAIRATEYRGAVCLEWEKLWHPYLPDLGRALAVAAERRWW